MEKPLNVQSFEKPEGAEPVWIFTDGACSGNPGPGGWGVVLKYKTHVRHLNGYQPHTTNNRMELLAAIHGLLALNRVSRVIVTTDSMYVKNGITQWLGPWKSRGWRKKDGDMVLNSDLWKRLDVANRQHDVEWRWIKGHAGHEDNETADQLARDAIRLGSQGSLLPDPEDDGVDPNH